MAANLQTSDTHMKNIERICDDIDAEGKRVLHACEVQETNDNQRKAA